MSDRAVGIDPGWRNPGAALMRYEASGWYVEDLPMLNSQAELLEWFVKLLRDPPLDLKIIACELVVNTMAVKWHEYEHNTISLRIIESTGAARLAARLMEVPFIELQPREIQSNILKSAHMQKPIMVKRAVRDVLAHNVKGWPKQKVNTNRSDAAATAIVGYRKSALERLRAKSPTDDRPKTVREYLGRMGKLEKPEKRELRLRFKAEEKRMKEERRAFLKSLVPEDDDLPST